MSLRDEQKRAKRTRILAAAEHQFATLGFEAATVRAIAKEAGVGLGTVLLYFESKHALLLEVWRERVLARGLAGPEGGACSLVGAAMERFEPFLRVYAEDLPLARVVVRELPWLEGSAAELHLPELLAFLAGLEALVAPARERGEVRPDVSPKLVATTFFSLYYGACLELTTSLGALPLPVVLARLEERLALVAAGLRPPALGPSSHERSRS